MTLVNKDGAPLAEESSDLIAKALLVKAIDVEERIVDFVASTDVVDAHDEIVDQSTWILEDYLSNPVVLWAHQSRELPIGKSVDVGIRQGEGKVQTPHLANRVEFATEKMNPKAQQVLEMLDAKFLRAVSVGFIPKSYRWELRNGVEVWVWSDCILKEISVTPVPANPQALSKMKEIAHDLRDFAKKSGRAIDGGDFAALRKTYAAGLRLRSSVSVPATLEVTDDEIPLRSQKRAERSHQPAPVGGHETPDTGKKESTMPTELETKQEQQIQKNAVEIAELKLAAKTAETAKSAVEAALQASESSVKTLTTEKSALETQNAKLVEERDAAKKSAEEAEGKLIELEVEGLVGKKITPAEKPEFVELRKTSPALFTRMVAQRSDLPATKENVIAGNNEENSVARSIDPTTPGANDDVLEEAKKLGGG